MLMLLPSNAFLITLLLGKIKENMCGIEEVTHPPEFTEVRHKRVTSPHREVTTKALDVLHTELSNSDKAILAGMLC